MSAVRVNVINLSPSLSLPQYETRYAAGMDVKACFDCGQLFTKYVQSDELNEKPIQFLPGDFVILMPGERMLIPTGLKVAIPEGYEIQVRPRSGLALKRGITVLNTPGTIDSDYRGMIGVILMNTSKTPFKFEHGDKIAQIVIKQVDSIEWNQVNSLDDTERGEGGFGHTSNTK